MNLANVTAANAADYEGFAAEVKLDGQVQFSGFVEYIKDGWVGIRQPQAGGRLDEAPAARVELTSAAPVGTASTFDCVVTDAQGKVLGCVTHYGPGRALRKAEDVTGMADLKLIRWADATSAQRKAASRLGAIT